MSEFTKEYPPHPAQSAGARSFALVNGDPGDFAGTMVRKAGEFLEAGEVGAARRCLEMGLQKVPDHPQCLAYLAVCVAVGQGNLDTAEKLARKLIEDHPAAATAFYALGRVELLRNRRGPAFRYFAKARQLVDGDEQVRGELDRIEPRRPPVLPCLSRNNPWNIVLGRLRAVVCRIFKP